MSKIQHPDNKAPESDELAERVLTATRRAVRAAVREHKLLGNPVAAWRNGKVVLIPPEEIEID